MCAVQRREGLMATEHTGTLGPDMQTKVRVPASTSASGLLDGTGQMPTQSFPAWKEVISAD